MSCRELGLIALALVGVVLVGCGGGQLRPPDPPTEQAALALVDQIVATIEAGDVGRVCDFGSGTCRQTLDRSDPGSVPGTPPHVIATRILPSSRNRDGTWNIGGRVVELCGVDGLGRPYVSEMLVFADQGRLIAKEPVYWIGLEIGTDPIADASIQPDPVCPGS